MELIQELFADDCLFRPTPENYLMIAAFCIIFCLSVIGNSIVVVVIVQQRSMRSVTNLYLLNLALSDLLLSVVCMPPTLVSSLLYCWVFGDLLCKLLAYLQPVVVTASAYTLAAIALERYYAICKPLHSRVWHTRSHALIVIGFVWLISIIANLFMLFMYELRTYNRNGLNCSPKYEPIVHFAYQIYMTMVLLIIPLVIMTVLYASVISSLKSGIKMDIAAIEISSYVLDNAKLFCSNNDNCSIFSKRKSFKLAKNNSIKNNNCQKLYKPRCNKYSLNNNNNNINKKWMKFNNKKPLSINNENKSNTINLISKNRFKCSFISMILFRSSQNHNKVLAHDIGNNYKEFESIDKIKKSTALLSEKSFSEKNNILESNERHNNHNAILSMARSVRSTHSGRTAQVKQRLIRMLIVIVIIFFCCWTPSYIWWLLLNAQDSFGIFNVWNSELNTFITVLTYLSSCTNPITYCFLNSKFRNALFLSFGCNCFSRRTLRSHFQRVYAPYISKNLLNEDKNQLLSNKRKSASICLINTSNFSNNNDVSDNTCQSDATSVTYDKSNNNQVTLLSSENLLQQEKQIKYKVNNKNNILDKKLIKITIDKLFDNYYDANNVSYASNVLNFFTKPLIVSNMLNLLQNAFIFFNASETIRWKQNLKTKNNLKVNAVVMKNPLINCYNYKINTGCEHCCSSKLKLKSFDKNVIDNTLTLFINKINYNFSKNINSDFNDNLIYNNANIFNQFTPDLINNNSNELAATKINNNIISVMPMILKKNSSSTSISPILSSFTVNNLKKTSKQKHLPNCFTLKSIHQSQSDPLISSKEFDLEIVNHANCESSI